MALQNKNSKFTKPTVFVSDRTTFSPLRRWAPQLFAGLFVLVFAGIGSYLLRGSHAATVASAPTISSTASAGASLPISTSLTGLKGTLRYVAPSGSDTTGKGTSAAPFATLSKAIAAATSGDSIVIRGGTYYEGDIIVPAAKSLTITAYPGETPTFDGSAPVTTAWTTSGNYKYTSYVPIPVTDGSGITFTTGQGLNGDGVGKYPDQAWIGGTEIQQVSTKAGVTTNKFFVDQTNKKIYLTAADAAKANIATSRLRSFITINSANTMIRGLSIQRYSNSGADYGVVKFAATADNSVLRQVKIADSAFIAVSYLGNSDINQNSTMDHVTVTNSNWMGVVATYTDNLTVDGYKATGMNPYSEFANAPQSGTIKTSRTRNTKVLNSYIYNNNGPGLWFDQSNYNVQVANNVIKNNVGSGIFFEISDNLYLVNNYVQSTGTNHGVRLSGSSGLKLVNNTIVGGAAPLGIYTDPRSIAGCANPAKPVCSGSYSSDRDSVRSYIGTIDWIPRLDLMQNNIIAYPTGNNYCTKVVSFCTTGKNATANVTISSVIHAANTSRGIPKTAISGNVYVNNSNTTIIEAISLGYTSPSAWATSLASSTGVSGLEATSLSGSTYVSADGTPTSTLAAKHSSTGPVPTDATLNQYLPSGYKHYGVSYK
ncbi:MAG: hypothetical protein JWM37_322 [Candidatus Saccharibacteria bacterium]|nr:hypothetical protein [Candidatus Saccharibacteria bacterium]